MGNYAEIAKFYDDITSKYFDYKEATAVLKELIRGKNILEIGTGTGNLAILLSQQGYKVTGTDSSEPMLQIAEKKQSNVKFILQDIKNMELNQVFDTIIIYEAVLVLIKKDGDYLVETYLENKEEILKSLKNVNRHLNQRGLFLISVKNERDELVHLPLEDNHYYKIKVQRLQEDKLIITHIIEKDSKVVAQSTIHKYRILLEEFEQLLNEANFKIIGFDKTKQFLQIQKA